MPRRTSPDKVSEIFRLKFKGYSTREASEETGVKVRTINNKLREFRAKSKREGVVRTAKSFGLEIEDLFTLASDLRKEGFEVNQCRAGFRIAKILIDLDVDLSKFDEFVNDVFQDPLKQGLTAIDLAEVIVQMIHIRKETGNTFQQIVKDYAAMSESVESLKTEFSNLQGKIEKMRIILEEETKEVKTSREELDRFKETRERLEELGVPLKEVSELKVLLDNIQEQGKDPVKVVETYSTVTQLNEKVRELDAETSRLEEKKNQLIDQTDKLEQELKQKQTLVEAVKSLDKQRLGLEDTRVVTEAVISISNRRGLTPKEAVKKFTEEISEHYEPLLNLGEEVERREIKLNMLEISLRDRKREFETVSDAHASRRIELDALKHLNEAGISKEDLITWNGILKELNTDPSTLRKEIKKLGDIEKYVEEKTTQVTELEQRINLLSQIRQQLESDIETLSSETVQVVKKNLAQLTQIMSQFEEEFLSPETGFKAQTENILEEVKEHILELFKTTETDWEPELDKFKEKLNQIVKEAKQAWELAYETGKEVEKYDTLRMLTKLTRGEKIDRHEALGSMNVIVDHLQSWCYINREQEMAGLYRQLKHAISERMKNV